MNNTSQTSSRTPIRSLRMCQPRNHCKIWMNRMLSSHRRIFSTRLAKKRRRPKEPAQWLQALPPVPLMNNQNCKIPPTRASASAYPCSPRPSSLPSKKACAQVGYPAQAALPACKIRLMIVPRATTYCNPYYKCEIYYFINVQDIINWFNCNVTILMHLIVK